MSVVLHHVDDRGVASLILNRPDLRNAFDESVIAALTAGLEALAAMPGLRALVLSGNGSCFSAGADLDWMRRTAAYGDAENRADADRLATLMRALDRFPRPTIARVQGPAYGGGVGLAACCDIVVAAPEARFCLSEVRLGLIPAVIAPYLVRAIGARQARHHVLTGAPFSAERAHALGLVHELAEAGGLDEAVARIVAELLDGAPDAQREAKALVALCDAGDREALPAETARLIALRRATGEARDGIRAFLSRTAPPWRQG